MFNDGKLNLLFEKYAESESSDIEELKACISLLKEAKWNLNLALIEMKTDYLRYNNEFTKEEVNLIQRLIRKEVNSLPEAELNDEEKLKCLYEFIEGNTESWKPLKRFVGEFNKAELANC